MNYRLGVDLGTTFTAAAVADGSTEPTVIGLGNRALQIPSVVFLKLEGDFLVGEAAERRGLSDPGRLAREFKRRIGDHVPIMVAGAPFSPQALTGHLLRWVVDRATERMGEPPAEVILTHPANWGPFRLELLDQIAVMAGLTSARRCTEPEAAAVQYASQTRVAPGDRVAVYDLGGGTFDACVLEKTDTGFRALGTAEGVEHLGGVDFDEGVLRHVLGALGPGAAGLDPDDPAVTLGLARLHRDCVEAKEALSTDVDTLVPVALPGLTTTVRVTRAEFELMIRPALTETIAAMSRALRNAQIETTTLRNILLVGGSSRIPLVSEMLYREFGVRTSLDTHPKHDVALGSVRIGREDTDTLPGVLLRLEPTTHPEVAATTTGTMPELAGPARATTAGHHSSAIAGPESVPKAPSRAPIAISTEEAEGETKGLGSEELGPNPQRAGQRGRLGLIAAAAATLVVVLVTTLILALRDPTPQSGPAAASPSPAPSHSAALKPLSSSYTWASGVNLTLSVTAERFGVRYPYCEDGSCGFAEEDDVRVLLRYEVSVPEGLSDRVDAAACPGKLVAGTSVPKVVPDSYARPIAGAISAGQTRNGVVEYSIDEGLREADLQVSSACGDITKTGETVMFSGPMPELRAENTPGAVGDRRMNNDYLKLRVDQVRDDVDDSGTYAALVEICARRTLSAEQKERVRAKTSWNLITRDRYVPVDDEWQGLLPLYPYGSLRKGSCVSGWVPFELNRGEKPLTIVYFDNSIRQSWRVAADDRPTATPEQTRTQPPASTPPDSTRRSRPPDRNPPSSEPSDEPSSEPSSEPPTPSAPPTRRPSPEPSFTS